jgi:hypothetical protein
MQEVFEDLRKSLWSLEKRSLEPWLCSVGELLVSGDNDSCEEWAECLVIELLMKYPDLDLARCQALIWAAIKEARRRREAF